MSRSPALISTLLALLGFCPAPLAATTAVIPENQSPVTLVCLGDSVTGVYYHTGGHQAYPEMLALALHRVRPQTEFRVINAGVSGNTTADGLARLDQDVLAHHPDVVTISFGLNDMSRLPLDQFDQNLRTLVDRCRQATARVVLCTPNAIIEADAAAHQRITQVCERIRHVAAELDVPLCDQQQAGEQARARDPWQWRLSMSDAIHPNMDGHKRMAEHLCFTLLGQQVPLQEVPPPVPPFANTRRLLRDHQPIKVIATPPLDTWLAKELHALEPQAELHITKWDVTTLSLPEIEKQAQAKVRELRPDLVLIGLPLPSLQASPQDLDDEHFVHALIWTLNWSLSFGHAEWDCVVVHPAVITPGSDFPRNALFHQVVRAQHVHLLDRPSGDSSDGPSLLRQAISRSQ